MTTGAGDRAPRGRITAYLFRYQLGDFLLLRAGVPGVLVTLIGFMMWKGAASGTDWTSPEGAQLSRAAFRALAGMFIALGGFMAIARLVTDDRANGHYRFLLSKPVSLTRFYAQQWFLFGACLTVITGLFAAWLQAATGPLPVREAMIVLALFWVLVGGVGFALSAATNADALILVLLYVITTVLQGVKAMPDTPMWPWLQQVTRLFPPLHKLDYVRDQLYSGFAVPWPHVAHVAVYGAAAFVIGIVILRRWSFAR